MQDDPDVSEDITDEREQLYGTADPRDKTPVDMCGNELSCCPHLKQWCQCGVCWCSEHEQWKQVCNKCDIARSRDEKIRNAEVGYVGQEGTNDSAMSGDQSKDGVAHSWIDSVFDVSDSPVRFDACVVKQAKKDWWQIKKHIKYARCRRSVPQHAIPNEVWRMILLLLPAKNLGEYKGVGCAEGAKNPILFCNMMFRCLCMIRHTKIAPLQWHCSKSFSLPKENPADVAVAYDAQRTVHTLDPVGKAFYKRLLCSASIPKPLHYEFAYLKGRRREAAIKQQLIVSWRLRINKISHDTTSYDMSNAFASLLFEVIDNILLFLVEPDDRELMQQRYDSASTSIPTAGEEICYKIGSGALPGDKIGADIFRIVFQSAIRRWVKENMCDKLAPRLP